MITRCNIWTKLLTKAIIAAMPQLVPQLRPPVELAGAGHWLQQDRPAEVTAALLDFLRSL